MTDTVVLIHGAGGSPASMDALTELLAPHVRVEVPCWLNHGGREVQPVLTIPALAADVLAQMDARGVRQAVFCGYSFGALVALYLARHHPERVRGVITLAAKVVYDARTIAYGMAITDEKFLRADPGLPARHSPQDWQAVVAANRAMMGSFAAQAAVGTTDLEQIGKPALVLSGDADQVVSAAETREVARLLNAQLTMFPGIAHPFERIPLALVAGVIRNWLAGLPGATTQALPTAAGAQHTLVSLHGAVGSEKTLAPLNEQLAPHAHLITPNWPGHGGRALPKVLSIPDVARDILEQLDARGIGKAAFFGYSLGGYVALYIARHFPHRVSGIATLATKVVFDQRAVEHIRHLSDPTRLQRPDIDRVEALKARHAPQDWRAVIDLNREMFSALGRQPPLTGYDLPLIRTTALVMSGDQDQLVAADETREIARLLNAPLLMFPGPAHPIELVPLPKVVNAMQQWLGAIPLASEAPASVRLH